MKKTLAMILAFVLVICATVAGTLAYLTDNTDTVTNTFTVGKIKIDLYETKDGTDTENSEHVMGKEYQLIPGAEYNKNPIVEVKAGSEACYLFVEFVEPTATVKEWLLYTSTLTADNGWTQGDGTDIPADVWYRVVTADEAAAGAKWHLLADDKIEISGEKLTEDNMPAEGATPELKYTAYACQLKNGNADFTPAQAWAQVAP